jgi:S-adenosylmethionine decarboxylase
VSTTYWIGKLKNHLRWKSTLPDLPPDASNRVGPKGCLITRKGKQYAGTHLLVDFIQATNLDHVERIRAALAEATRAANATLLHIHLHHFSEMGGVSGVAVLAESHISIHTWPQYGYAAVDIFMCGDCNPYLALPVLRCALHPKKVNVEEFMRGQLDGLDLMPVTSQQTHSLVP